MRHIIGNLCTTIGGYLKIRCQIPFLGQFYTASLLKAEQDQQFEFKINSQI
jgi:hypothetical protein